jgi:hypothetical protein
VLRALDTAGGLPEARLARVFGWDEERIARAIAELEREGRLARAGSGRDRLVVLPRLATKAAA